MNYDTNDGIPPYDMNFDNNPNGEILSDDSNYNLPSDDSLSMQNQQASDNQVSQEQLNVGQFVDGMQSEDYVKPQGDAGPSKNKSSVSILPVVIISSLLIIGGALAIVYGTDVIPNLSFNFGKKINTTKTDNFFDEKANNDIVNLPEDSENSLSDSSENFQDADINVKRDGGQSVVSGKDEVADNLDMPPLSGANNQTAKNDLLGGAQNNNGDSSMQNKLRTIGRVDPFNPNSGNDQLFDVLVPPTDPTPDLESQMLVTLKVTGIMYTAEAPSAIIDIAGFEQLVRTGDSFEGFTVVRITKDKVTVRAGKNVYTASVGESVDVDSAGVNAIPNLNKKFAGPYSKGSGRIIEINTIR